MRTLRTTPFLFATTLSCGVWALSPLAGAQEVRVFALNPVTPQGVHWDATSNLGPLGAFNQSYSFSGDIVVDFDNNPAFGMARITGARLQVPNSVVAALMSGPAPATVAFFDLELAATSPDFVIAPTFPQPVFATTLDLVVSSGTMQIEPPFGPALWVQLAGTSLGSLPVSGSFPTVGPTQQMTLGAFSFDMHFAAAGWNGTFSHNVTGLSGLGGCPAPVGYCPSDPNSPGGGTELNVVGSTSVFTDDFTLVASHAPANTFGVFFYGGRRDQVASGAGTVCIGGPLARLGVVPTGPAGMTQLRVVLANHQVGPLALAPGAHANFQFFHRAQGPTQATWNFSNAVAVTFCP